MRAIILAAGKGTRLHSAEHDLPKVMHTVNGTPLIDIAVSLVDFVKKEDVYIVVGYKREMIEEHLGPEYNYVLQSEQLGTGHAVACASEFFKDYEGDVIVTYGDMPLYRRESLRSLCEHHEKSGADCTVMYSFNDELLSYGRIVRDGDGNFAGIVEAKDCTEEQRKITELNSGVAVFKGKSLFEILPKLRNNNKQSEYYLTDVPMLMLSEGKYKVDTFAIEDGDEIRGVNTPEELVTVERILNEREK